MEFGKTVNRSKSKSNDNRDTVKKQKGVVIPSGMITGKITKAYVMTTSNGADMIKVDFSTAQGNIYFSDCFKSGKKDKPEDSYKLYWTDKDGVDHDLPGYAKLNELLVAAVGDDMMFTDDNDNEYVGDIFDLLENGDVEVKPVPIYSWKDKKEVHTKVPVVTILIGKEVKLGLHDCYVDIPFKDSNGKIDYKKPSGNYKRINEIDKFFNIDTAKTYSEFVNEEEAIFYKDWIKGCKDVTFDNTKNKIAPKDGETTDKSSNGSSSVNDLFKD